MWLAYIVTGVVFGFVLALWLFARGDEAVRAANGEQTMTMIGRCPDCGFDGVSGEPGLVITTGRRKA